MSCARYLALALLLVPTAVRAEDGAFVSDGVKIHYRVQGQGEPVVLIHGFSDCIENTWDVSIRCGSGLMDVLSRRYQVIALDCRGHGQSEKPHGKQYGQEMVRDVIRLLDHRQIRQAHLVGYSMGAFIAGNVLLRYPDRVRSVILGGGAPFTVSGYRKAGWFRDVVRETENGLAQGKGFDPIIRFLTPPNEPPPTEQQIAEINRTQLAGQDPEALAAVLRQWAEWSVEDRQLTANRVPVLAVVGSRDPLKRTVAPLRGRLARLEVVEIAGADHMTAPAQPAFLQAVEAFLARQPEPVAPATADRTISVDDFIELQMRKQHIPGLALAIVRDGKLVKAKGYGLASLELNVPVLRKTAFELGSITKQFTAMAIMMLVEEGKVRLDERITTYLSGLPDAWRNVTVRHLLTHTSGIKSYTEVHRFDRITLADTSPEEVIQTVADYPLKFQPGEKWEYSNTGYYLLGLIVEKASGKPYATFLQERIFGPLGMNRTRLNDLKAVIPDRSSGYSWRGSGYRNATAISMTWPYAAGALLSTVEDLAKWDAALYTEKLVKQTSLDQMWTPATLKDGKSTEYGFGWFIGKMNEHRLIGHSGGIPGFSTDIARYVDDRLTVIALLNQERGDGSVITRGVAGLTLPALVPPVPKPIEDREPQVTARVREFIQQAAAGHLEPEQFTPEGWARLFPDRLKEEGEMLKSLGPLQSTALLERREEGDHRSYRYRVVFHEDSLSLYIDLAPDNKIASLFLGTE